MTVVSTSSVSGSGLLKSIQSWQEHLSPDSSIYIAYSGGLDSHVLLHLAASLREQLPYAVKAIHVDHQLHADSAAWVRHCQQVCDALSLPLQQCAVSAGGHDGDSPEARARELRYAAFRDCLKPGDLLLTAHHQDDQLETFFLQLLRGSGVLGLSAMPPLKALGEAWHGRPLLDTPRTELQDYAGQHALDWIDDSSNSDVRYDRNYIRHKLVPIISQRWPGFAGPVSRYHAIARETQGLLDELAQQDLIGAAHKQQPGLLSCEAIRVLSGPRQKNLLRHWLRTQQLSIPTAKQLGEIIHSLIYADPDGGGEVSWHGGCVYRYRHYLYAVTKPFAATRAAVTPWDVQQPLTLGDENLQADEVRGKGLKLQADQATQVTIRFYQGGEKLRLPGRKHHSKLKNLFQEAGLPPWQRQIVPLIYVAEELAMVTGLWTAEKFTPAADEPARDIHWSGFDKLVFISSPEK